MDGQGAGKAFIRSGAEGPCSPAAVPCSPRADLVLSVLSAFSGTVPPTQELQTLNRLPAFAEYIHRLYFSIPPSFSRQFFQGIKCSLKNTECNSGDNQLQARGYSAPGCQATSLRALPLLCPRLGGTTCAAEAQTVASALDNAMPQAANGGAGVTGQVPGLPPGRPLASRCWVSWQCPALQAVPTFSWPHPQNSHRASKAQTARAPSGTSRSAHSPPLSPLLFWPLLAPCLFTLPVGNLSPGSFIH